MKQKLKQALSLFLILSMLLGITGNTVSAGESESGGDTLNPAVENGDLEVSGNTDAGNLIASAISEKQAADSAMSASENHITRLDISGNTATVEYVTDTKAEIVVAVYEKDSVQMLASGKSVVYAGSSSVKVTIDGTIPEYFIASAFLLDVDSHEALGSVFTTELYTKEMQDIQDATVDDFKEEEVLNLDNNSETNFAVYSENTLVAEEGASFNQVAENNDGSYTVSNADSSFKNLTVGDTISYACDDGTMLLIKVGSVSVHGDTVTIQKDANADLTDFFDYVKIEADSANPAQSGSEGIQAAAWEDESIYSDSKSKDFNETIADKKDQKIKVTFKGNVTFNYSVYVKYYLALDSQYLCVKIDYQVKASVNLSGKIEPDGISLGKIEVPLLPCVNVGFTPTLVLKVSAEIDWYGEWSGTLGFEYDTNNGGRNLCEGPKYNEENGHLNLEGTLYIGIEATPYVNIITDDLCRAELKASLGLKFILTEKLLSSKSDGYIHDCSVCHKGELRILLNWSVSLKITKETVGKALEFPGIDEKLTDLYYSEDYKEFGCSTCPHIRYEVAVNVEDEGEPVSDAEISAVDTESGKPAEKITEDNKNSAVTGADGKTTIYLPNGSYTIKAATSEFTGTTSIKVKEEKTSAKISLTARRAYPVTVHAVDEEGNPVSGAVLSFEGDEKEEPGSSVTDESGNITVNLTPGDYVLQLLTDDLMCKETITVEKAPKDIILTMKKIKYGIVHLTAVDSSGAPVRGAFISGTGLTETLLTDTNGTVTFKVMTGEYVFKVAAIGAGSGTCTVTVTEGEQDVSVVLRKTGEEETEESEDTENTLGGEIGDLSWTLKDGVLRISGNGEMPDYNYFPYSPWYEKRFEIEEIVVENGVTSIGYNAFTGCSNLLSITLPKGLTSIRNSAFSDCSSLSSITLPKGLTSIGDYAFSSCSNLPSITLPEGVTSIGNDAFEYCSSLQSITLPEGVTSIGIYAFYGCSSLQSITLPEGVTSIKIYAFCGCSSLSSITLPKGLTVIESCAFYGCSSLPSIMLPKGLTVIGGGAFEYCSSLQSITLPKGLTSIENSAFSGCSSLQSITLPEGVTSIGNYAFSSCSNLSSITLPEGLTSIGDHAFDDCRSLQSITLPEGLTSIGDYAFRYCRNLPSIMLLEGLTSIGDYAFHDCRSLQSVMLPEGVTSIGDHAFDNCWDLLSITLPEGLTSVGDYTFSHCSSLQSIALPEGVTSIGDYAFSRCMSLPSIMLPEGLTSIGDHAFEGCWNLPSITLPKGLTFIGDEVFDTCLDLKNIYFCGNMPQFSDNTFFGYGFSATAYYPQNNSTWTDIGDYGGGNAITWVPFDPSALEDRSSEKMVTDSSSMVISLDEITLDDAEEIMPSETIPFETEMDEIILDLSEETEPVPEEESRNTEESLEDDVLIVEESAREVFAKSDGLSGVSYRADFTDLMPDTSCIFTAVWDENAADLLAPENLLYISQVKTDSEGSLSVNYRPRDGLAGTTKVYGFSRVHTIHTWNSGTVTKPATCTASGIRTYTCTACGKTKEELIPATGKHNWNRGSITRQPTATKKGIRTYTCYNCGITKTEMIPATGKKIHLKNASVNNVKARKYTGKVIKPKIKIILNGHTLKKDTDYKVSYTKSASVGKKKIIIKGIGDYTGTRIMYFNVFPVKAKLSKIAVGKKKLTVKIKTQKGAKYQIQYREKGTKKWKSVLSSNGKKVIKNLKKGKKYQVRVRAYAVIKGKKMNGSWSAVKVSGKVK